MYENSRSRGHVRFGGGPLYREATPVYQFVQPNSVPISQYDTSDLVRYYPTLTANPLSRMNMELVNLMEDHSIRIRLLEHRQSHTDVAIKKIIQSIQTHTFQIESLRDAILEGHEILSGYRETISSIDTIKKGAALLSDFLWTQGPIGIAFGVGLHAITIGAEFYGNEKSLDVKAALASTRARLLSSVPIRLYDNRGKYENFSEASDIADALIHQLDYDLADQRYYDEFVYPSGVVPKLQYFTPDSSDTKLGIVYPYADRSSNTITHLITTVDLSSPRTSIQTDSLPHAADSKQSILSLLAHRFFGNENRTSTIVNLTCDILSATPIEYYKRFTSTVPLIRDFLPGDPVEAASMLRSFYQNGTCTIRG